MKEIFHIHIGPGEWEFKYTAVARAVDAGGFIHESKGQGDTTSQAVQAALAQLRSHLGSDWTIPTGDNAMDYKAFIETLDAIASLNAALPRPKNKKK